MKEQIKQNRNRKNKNKTQNQTVRTNSKSVENRFVCASVGQFRYIHTKKRNYFFSHSHKMECSSTDKGNKWISMGV